MTIEEFLDLFMQGSNFVVLQGGVDIAFSNDEASHFSLKELEDMCKRHYVRAA